MILRPFMRLKRKTTAPTGHSTTPATTNATNPRVGPSTLHRQGLLVVPHWTHIGKPTPPVILFIAINCPQQDENNTKRQLPRKNKRLFENCEACNGLQKGKLTKKTASVVEISEWAFNVTPVLRSLWMIFIEKFRGHHGLEADLIGSWRASATCCLYMETCRFDVKWKDTCSPLIFCCLFRGVFWLGITSPYR